MYLHQLPLFLSYRQHFHCAIQPDLLFLPTFVLSLSHPFVSKLRVLSIEGKNKNIGDADITSYIGDFDATHGTSYSEMVSEKDDIQEGIYEQTKNAQLEGKSLEFKTREIQDIGI